MSWNPNEDQIRYLRLLMTMTLDYILKNGVDSFETFKENADLIIEKIKKLEESP